MHLFCFNPPTLRAKYEFKHIEIDLLLAPVVQKVDSAIHQINLYPQDGAIAFPNIYPLDTDIHLLNNWDKLARDVTAAIFVVKNKSISLGWELNSIFKGIIRKN